MYDYLVVSSGLCGAVFTQQEYQYQHGKSVLVMAKRDHVAGNVYMEKVESVNFNE